ncbi:hypothetical protein [Aeoliella sp. SH292]|uniref:hypothetical protein n=1 Tax=Aeoliella sp. SH292 TaxID=3454464 RepID=UPI003F967D1C
MRKIHQTYEDPLSLVWVHAAEQMGMRVERSAEVNASWDGAGTLTIGTPETLDPDDSLAQMILHETCHALVEGPDCLTKLDWGLPNHDRANRFHEHACLRLQAALADQIGMRKFFASTTMFRSYYDALPQDPLADGDDPAIPLAQSAWQRAKEGPWAPAIDQALKRTQQIAKALEGITTPASLWHHA